MMRVGDASLQKPDTKSTMILRYDMKEAGKRTGVEINCCFCPQQLVIFKQTSEKRKKIIEVSTSATTCTISVGLQW